MQALTKGGSSFVLSKCSMGPCFVYGIDLVCIGIQIRGPHERLMGNPWRRSGECN